jgi:hypothetical protein
VDGALATHIFIAEQNFLIPQIKTTMSHSFLDYIENAFPKISGTASMEPGHTSPHERTIDALTNGVAGGEGTG